MNQSRTIPISELGVPDQTTISIISQEDIRRVLAEKVRRGFVICSILYVIGFICFIINIAFYHNTTLSVGSIIWTLFFRILAMLSRQKMMLAHRISIEPHQVFWAHPCRALIRSHLIKYEGVLTLHMRTGQLLEVAMSRKQMLNVVEWLRRRNSGIRIGDYD